MGAIPDLEQAWARAQPAVAGLLLALLRDRHDADDCLQEVAMVVLRAPERFDPSRDFVAWCLGIARNKALEWHRRTGRTPGRSTDPAVLDALTAAAQDLAPALAASEAALRHCLDELPPRSRTLVEATYRDDLSTQAVGERLGMSGVHVRVSLHRIRALLRTCIERRLGQEA